MDVRIEELPPMWVAAVRVVSGAPEPEAWQRLRAWAEPRGLLADQRFHPIFGFNNPAPSGNGGEYGYELWMRIDAPMRENGGGVTFKRFGGGLFAVTACRLPQIGETWRGLREWAQSGEYRLRRAHELERVISAEELVLELCLPIAPRRRRRTPEAR
jgi:DNA gyrase inhibitor GyrI